MSDPRDELLDRIQLELYQIRRLFQGAYDETRLNAAKAANEGVYGYAAGQVLAVVVRLVNEIEQFKRARSKAGSR